MKLKLESWHLILAFVIAVFSAFIGACIQIILLNYGVFDHWGAHQDTLNGTGFTESHDFTFVNDSLCFPDSIGSTAALTQRCVMNGYTTYASAECSAFSGRPGHHCS